MYITRTKEISIIRSYQWQCGPQNITGFSTISFFKCTNHEPLRTTLVPSSLFCVGQILIANTDYGKLHFAFTLSATSSLPRQTGSVLIDTGCIGCPWVLLSRSVQVSCKNSGDFMPWSSSVSPSNSLSLPWLSKSDESSASYWGAVPSSSIKIPVCKSSNASEPASLSLSWLSSSAACSASLVSDSENDSGMD